MNKFAPREGYTVKPALSGHSKIDKTKILKTNGNLMKVESIAVLNKIFQSKIVNIFLPINFNICFGCSKEPSH